jgi:Domain of unknown function (DUF4331)
VSNHFSAGDHEHPFQFPGGDARLDLTDLFVFTAPGNRERTVLIMNSNPFLEGTGFHPDAIYRFNIDNDGDSLADAAFSFTFSELKDGRQTATAHYATGRDAQSREPLGAVLIQGTPVGFDQKAAPVEVGGGRLFVGTRSDPFFADADNVLEWLTKGANGLFEWKGKDTFGEGNVNSIAMEVPNDMLGPGPRIGVWLTISLRKDGKLVPMDREGNPSFNPILNPNEIKNEFNATDPVDDVKKFVKPLSEVLVKHGYTPEAARAAALTVLPDILHYDRTKPARYPNGRTPTDDVFSLRFAFMTNGQIKPQPVKPHEDLLSEFPFMGIPHPTKVAESV